MLRLFRIVLIEIDLIDPFQRSRDSDHGRSWQCGGLVESGDYVSTKMIYDKGESVFQ